MISTFSACDNFPAQVGIQNKDSIVKINQIVRISTSERKSFIDTNKILSNQNLRSLIYDLENTKLIEKKTIKYIPNFIKTFLDSLTSDNFSIANPGENWQSSDLVIEELPNRELIYLGIGGNITLLAYYSGGLGVSEHILIFKYKNKHIIDFWSGNFLKEVKTKNEILNYLKANVNKDRMLNLNYIEI